MICHHITSHKLAVKLIASAVAGRATLNRLPVPFLCGLQSHCKPLVVTATNSQLTQVLCAHFLVKPNADLAGVLLGALEQQQAEQQESRDHLPLAQALPTCPSSSSAPCASPASRRQRSPRSLRGLTLPGKDSGAALAHSCLALVRDVVLQVVGCQQGLQRPRQPSAGYVFMASCQQQMPESKAQFRRLLCSLSPERGARHACKR